MPRLPSPPKPTPSRGGAPAALSPSLPAPAPRGTARLEIWALPGARREGAAGMHGERLRVRVRAQAMEGRANEALLDWLAAELDVPRRNLTLTAGAASRAKSIAIAGMDAATLAAWVQRVSTSTEAAAP
ncbi:DUF167 domain-containing protein [Verrucomicrobia bacterium LW23]|nr:DUF167 domain-containing protein [Verrucomicrobia bacterium LW23]